MQFRRGQACRALLLPQRSLLVMAGEARLAWAHYLPSHKADAVGGQIVPRRRRVSLTFRQAGACPLTLQQQPAFGAQHACEDDRGRLLQPAWLGCLRDVGAGSGRAPVHEGLQV